VGLLEIFIGLSLLLGLWVCAARFGAGSIIHAQPDTLHRVGATPWVALLRSPARYCPAAVAVHHFLRR
jgi:hypothetical protein